MKIDKDVPYPTVNIGTGKYPFGEMDIGDSIYFENDDEGKRVMTAARQYGYRYGCKFSSRKQGNGRRIWLLSKKDK